jgi:hypothetical protein
MCIPYVILKVEELQMFDIFKILISVTSITERLLPIKVITVVLTCCDINDNVCLDIHNCRYSIYMITNDRILI